MPPSPPTGGGQIKLLIPANNWYVHFPDLDGDHNNHLVVAFAMIDDNITVVPLIASHDNNKEIVQASTISTNYILLNPYNECSNCVRPPDASSSAR